jgi:hypothetical protein
MSSYQVDTIDTSGGGGGPSCPDILQLYRTGSTPATSITWDSSAPENIVWAYQRQRGSSISFNPVLQRCEISSPGTYKVSVWLSVAGISATETLTITSFLTPYDWPPLQIIPGEGPTLARIDWAAESVNPLFGDVRSYTILITAPITTTAINPYFLHLKIYRLDGSPPDTAPTLRQGHWIIEKVGECDDIAPRTIPNYGSGG